MKLCLSLLVFFFAGLLSAEDRIHVVRKDENLFRISLRYGISQERLKTANHLKDDFLPRGFPLRIPDSGAPEIKANSETKPKPEEETPVRAGESAAAEAGKKYRVQEGDTLFSIARRQNVALNRLSRINGLETPDLRVGQMLLIPRESLSRTASLQPAVKTKTGSENAPASRKKDEKVWHVVQSGETLWSISRQYRTGTVRIKKSNHLPSDKLIPGQKLALYPQRDSSISILGENESSGSQGRKKEENRKLASYLLFPEEKEVVTESQPDKSYEKLSAYSIRRDYLKAKERLNQFNKNIELLPRQSNSLKNYSVFLDPGHGGMDPGAIVSSKTGDGKIVYVVEDEYNYDLSMRLYKLLKLNGARVGISVISPNQTIRNTGLSSQTFVNEKNEVYNDKVYSSGSKAGRPIGGSWGLEQRVKLAQKFFRQKPEDHKLFLSIHADNTPFFDSGKNLLYNPESRGVKPGTQNFIKAVLPKLGHKSNAHPQLLAVLKNNPADAAVLVEVRNIFYPKNSWALRNNILRQQDAEMILNGILSYARSRANKKS